MQGLRPEPAELVGNDRHEARIGLVERTVGRKARGIEDELAQKRRHRHHAAAGGQPVDRRRVEVKGPHGQVAGTFYIVADAWRHPHGLLRRHHPGTFASADGHDPGHRIDQLGAEMTMERKVVRTRMIAGQGHHRPVGDPRSPG